MRFAATMIAAFWAFGASAVQMASQPWVENRIAAATNALPAAEADLTPATNYTDKATNAIASAIVGGLPSRLRGMGVVMPWAYGMVYAAGAGVWYDGRYWICAFENDYAEPYDGGSYWNPVLLKTDIEGMPYVDTSEIPQIASVRGSMARVEALSNAVYGVLGGLPDKSAVLSTNATGMVNKPVLGMFFAKELDASPQNVKIYQPEMDYLAVNFLGADTYMFTLTFGLYDSWRLDEYPQLVMRYMDVTNIVPPMITAATNALAQSMGGTPAEIAVSGTVPYSKGLVNLTVSRGGTLACNTNDWPNGAQVLVSATLPATYTAASGINPVGYSAMPSDGQYLLVFTRLGQAVYVSVITSVE